MKALDPFYLVDSDVLPFTWDYRQDLTAAGEVEVVADGVFVILKKFLPKGQVAIINSIVPYLMQRANIDSPDETVVLLPTGVFDGLVTFNAEITSLTAFIAEINYNAPTRLSAANNTTRAVVRSGDTHPVGAVSINVQNWNPLFRLVVPSDTEMRVTFQIVPQNPTAANQLPVYPFIGTAGVVGTARIDWAGCVVSGVLMPQKKFDDARGAAQSLV